jgi:hypothetical protein
MHSFKIQLFLSFWFKKSTANRAERFSATFQKSSTTNFMNILVRYFHTGILVKNMIKLVHAFSNLYLEVLFLLGDSYLIRSCS